MTGACPTCGHDPDLTFEDVWSPPPPKVTHCVAVRVVTEEDRAKRRALAALEREPAPEPAGEG